MSLTNEIITKALLEVALKTFFSSEHIKVIEYAYKEPVVPKGENYASDLFRISVKFRDGANQNILSVIVKHSPNNEVMKKFIEQMRLFEKEVAVFTDILPDINKILGKLGPITGKCIYSTTYPQPLIMFEDLKVDGYKMMDRRKGLDMEHSLFAIENIAKLHASSLILHQMYPDLIERYNEGLFFEIESIVEWIKSGFELLIKACSRWPGFEQITVKLKKLRSKVVSKGLDSCKPKTNGFNVLNHGDAWINNFMFSYTTEEKLKNFRFVDFQLVIYSSPVLDLYFFWITSPIMEIKRLHLTTIINHYYESLKNTLKLLNYPVETIPTYEELLEEWKLRGFYGLIVSITSLALIKAPPRKDAALEVSDNGDEGSFRYDCYNNEIYKKHMQFLLPYFDSLGILDCED